MFTRLWHDSTIERQLPPLPPNDVDATTIMRYKYSFSYIADELMAYKIFERRKSKSKECEWRTDDNEAEEDAAIHRACIICNGKANLQLCARCKHVVYCGKECQARHWKGVDNGHGQSQMAHKKVCHKMMGKPLRFDLDHVEDNALIDSIVGIGDLTYGFILVSRVRENVTYALLGKVKISGV